MTISSIASIAASVSQTLGNNNSGVAASINSLISSKSDNIIDTHPDVSALATAALLQSQVSSLRVASQNIVQAQSQLSVADGGASQISEVLGRLADLSQRASATDLSQAQRIQLNVEFQQLRDQITRIASGTRFNGQSLLDGSLDSQTVGENVDNPITVGGLTDQNLFKGKTLDLTSADGAKAAAAAIADAQHYVSTQQANIGALQQGLDFAGAAVDTATQNQEAAHSFLDDNDVASASTQSAQQLVQGNATASLLAQTNKLGSNILQLLNE